MKTLFFIVACCCYTIVRGQPERAVDRPSRYNTDTVHVLRPPRVMSIFPGTRIINGSSTTNLAGGVLDFRISHRFGRLNEGAQNFFGLDNATTRIGLDYGIARWFMVGIGHNTLEKEDDGFVKLKVLNQRAYGSPVALNYFGAMSVETMPTPALPAGEKWLNKYRLFYAHQVLIARQFGNRLSLQLMPTLVHYNIVDSNKNDNNTFAIGLGGRIKLDKRLAITGEYYYRINNKELLYNGQPTCNALSIGLEIESGGHVFQLLVTNSQGLTERTFVGQTTDRWSKGELHLGFNISRIFTIVKPTKYPTD